MKKITGLLLVLICIVSFVHPSLAINEDIVNDPEIVNNIGQKILKENNLPAKIEFKIADEDHINAYANIKNEVYVYKGLLKVVDTEDELAGVISHEIGHIVNSHVAKQSLAHIVVGPVISVISKISEKLWIKKLAEGIGLISLSKISRDDEYEADMTGADLMISAGYHPLGIISVLNKVSQNHLDIISTHPSADKRLVFLYDYISYNYPRKVEGTYPTESYKEFAEYMAEVTKIRESNPKEQQKYLQKQEKLRAARLERAREIKEADNKWQSTFVLLQNTAQVLGQ